MQHKWEVFGRKVRYHYSLRLRTLLGEREALLHMSRTRTLCIWVKKRVASAVSCCIGRSAGDLFLQPEANRLGSLSRISHTVQASPIEDRFRWGV